MIRISKRKIRSLTPHLLPPHLFSSKTRALSSVVPEPHSTELSQDAAPLRRRHLDTDIEDILNKKQGVPQSGGGESGVLGLATCSLQQHCDSVIESCDQIIEQLEDCRSEEVLSLVDSLSNQIVSLFDISLFLATSNSNQSEGGLAVLEQAEHYIDSLNTNEALYAALKRLVNDTTATDQLNSEGVRALTMLLTDCKNNGMNLSEKRRDRVQKLMKQVGIEGREFVKNSVAPTLLPLEQCPEPLLGLADKGDAVSLYDWCGESPSDGMREQAYLNYYKHDTKQESTLHRLLDKRQQLATSTGYSNFAERVLQGSMAGSPEAVSEFLHELHSQLRPVVREEFYEIEKFKYTGSKFWFRRGFSSVGECVVFPWDLHYNTAEMRKLWIKQETKSPLKPEFPRLPDFLSVGSVVEQIGVWFEDTFGVTLVPEQPLNGELWRPEVVKLAVEHESDGLLGFLYLDLYDSSLKRSPACNHAVKSGDGKQVPVSVIECGFEPGNGYRPPHLNMHSLERLFREMGSAIHLMLSRTQYSVTSMKNVPDDVKHVTGYLFRNISRHPAFLHHVMKHHTRTRLFPRIGPQSISVMCNAVRLVQGNELENQLLYSALDHTLHTEWPYHDGRTSTDVFGHHCEHFTHLPYVEGTAPHLRFSQLYTMGGRVYSHLWSQAIANVLYEELFSLDPFSRHAGEYMREHFLKLGAAKNPREMMEYLTGSKLTADRLAHALTRPVELSQNHGHGFYVQNKGGAQQWWHREISSPDSSLLTRLSSSHPHLVSESGNLKIPPPFNRESLQRTREKTKLLP